MAKEAPSSSMPSVRRGYAVPKFIFILAMDSDSGDASPADFIKAGRFCVCVLSVSLLLLIL
ncbi:hypothetical protein YC2023_070511 [Brassica napus]